MTETVLEAFIEGSIRRWLEVVWTYDDATYQHCLLGSKAWVAFFAGVCDRSQIFRGAIKGYLLRERSRTTSAKQESRLPF